jgi:hypothetical protein
MAHGHRSHHFSYSHPYNPNQPAPKKNFAVGLAIVLCLYAMFALTVLMVAIHHGGPGGSANIFGRG